MCGCGLRLRHAVQMLVAGCQKLWRAALVQGFGSRVQGGACWPAQRAAKGTPAGGWSGSRVPRCKRSLLWGLDQCGWLQLHVLCVGAGSRPGIAGVSVIQCGWLQLHVLCVGSGSCPGIAGVSVMQLQTHSAGPTALARSPEQYLHAQTNTLDCCAGPGTASWAFGLLQHPAADFQLA